MESRCRVFTVGSAADNAAEAALLANAFYPGCAAEIKDLEQAACFQGMSAEDFDKLVFVGHGSNDHFGTFTAAAFVKQFTNQFLRLKPAAKKDSVHHLYLIGCSLGQIDEQSGNALAQAIVNALFKAGFVNAVMHCVAKPEEAVGDVIIVKVNDYQGSSGLAALTHALAHKDEYAAYCEPGSITACLLSHQDAELLSQWEEDGHHQREINELINNKAFFLIRDGHPEVELNKPHHIFLPNEKLATRKERIQRDTIQYLNARHLAAINLLKQRRDYLMTKPGIKHAMATRLDFMIYQIELADDLSWRKVLADALHFLREHIFYGSLFHSSSRTVALIEALCRDDLLKANLIVEGQAEETTPSPERRALKKMQPVSENKNAVLSQYLQTRTVDDAAEVRENIIPSHLKHDIHDLSVTLNHEIADIRKGCFNSLFVGEIAAKQAKIQVLNDLAKAQNYRELLAKAHAAMRHDMVIKSVKHKRVRRLLESIIKLGAELPLHEQAAVLAKK